jgi:hypothetical protein
MKGPGHGRQHDVRRLWECPVCQKRAKTGGHIVNLRCEACARNKTGDTAWMKLLETRRQAGVPYPVAKPVDESAEGKQGVETPNESPDASALS